MTVVGWSFGRTIGIGAIGTVGAAMEKTKNGADFLRVLLGTGRFVALWRGVLLVLFAVSVLGIGADIRNTLKFGQVDLRNRVVGARVMLLGQNPYTYHWSATDPTTLLDPLDDPKGGLSRVTVTPLVLAMHAAMARVPYHGQKLIWLVCQLACYLGIAWFAMIRAREPSTKAAILVVVALFSSTVFWRMHVERGQLYALFSCLATIVVLGLSRKGVLRELAMGVLLGGLVCLRPQFGIMVLPLLVYRSYIVLLGTGGGLILGVLIPTMISSSIWPEYVDAMLHYAKSTAPSPVAEGISSTWPASLPVVVEGASNLSTAANFWDKGTSLKATLAVFKLRPPSVFYAGLLTGAICMWVIYLKRLRRMEIPLDFSASKTLAMVLLAEVFIPIPRTAYSDVILVATVVTILATGGDLGLRRTWEWALLVLAWCFASPFPPWVGVAFRFPEMAVIPPYAILAWGIFAPFRASRSNSSAFE